MAVFSGKNGSIQYDSGGGTYENIVDCSGWTMERSVEVFTYASCSTGGFKAKVAGVKSASGELKGYMDDASHISTYINEGDEVSTRLYLDATNYHIVPLMITSISEEIDINDGNLVEWSANYENNGAYTLFQNGV